MFCQKCRTPLRLDSSLDNLNPTAFNLLAEASGKSPDGSTNHGPPPQLLYGAEQKQRYEQAVQNSRAPTFKRTIAPVRHGLDSKILPSEGQAKPQAENSAMSFIMLTESQVVAPPPMRQDRIDQTQDGNGRRRRSSSYADGAEEPNILSHKMETTARLFEILSSRSDIDHPICAECTDILIEGMEKRLANATKERDAYVEFLRNANADLPTDEERQQAKEGLKSMRDEENAALAELEQLESEKNALDKEIASLDREAHQLDEEEVAFWRERNAFSQVLSDYQNERDSINLRYDHDSRLLEKLQRTNVYNDTFCISHDKDGFATINNLRLGRVSNKVNVDWPEISAAWGLSLLLLATVAEKLEYEFQGYRLNPVGSTSTIDRFENSPQASLRDSSQSGKSTATALPLFYSTDLPVQIPFLTRHFDAAMIAFLECVRQLGKHVERTTAGTPLGGEDGLRLPVEINKDKINLYSIKFGEDESWTSACKLTLAGCKFLLAHASNVNGQRKGST